MPYTAEHKARTRARIVAAARRLFNHRGFAEVSIDEIMAAAGLTRGGFYNHFARKEDLYAEAVTHILSCKPGSAGRPHTAIDPAGIVTEYLSDHRQSDLDNACPLAAYPSDAARSSKAVKRAYCQVLCGLIGRLQNGLPGGHDARSRAMAMATLCVGGMMLARAVDDAELGAEIRRTAVAQALAIGRVRSARGRTAA